LISGHRDVQYRREIHSIVHPNLLMSDRAFKFSIVFDSTITCSKHSKH
jgi:hypothetical protein